MPSAQDLTSQKFGRLTAVSVDKSTGKRLWRFICDCGSTKIANAAFVKYGSVRSCGCLRKETTAATRFKDLTGRQVGRLTVMGELADRGKHGEIRWSCVCVCGATPTMTTHKLGKKSPTLSCGCLQREFARALGTSSKKENPVSLTPAYRAALKAARRLRPEVAMAERVSRLMGWALASVGAIKTSGTFDMLGYTPAQLRMHVEKQFLRGMSWANRSEWELDHITPISSAKNREDVIALNQLSNMRPLWSLHNNQKSSRRHFLI